MAILSITRCKHLIPYAFFLAKAGEPIHRLLETAKLPAGCLDDPEMLLSSAAIWRFRNLASRITGLPNITIDVMENLEFTSLSESGATVLGAPTLHRALTEFRTFTQAETTNVIFELEEKTSGEVFFQHQLQLGHRSGEWHTTLYALQWMIKLVQLAHPHWTPASVWFNCSTTKSRQIAVEQLGIVNATYENPCTGFVIPHSMLAAELSAPDLPLYAESNFSGRNIVALSAGQNYASTLKQFLLPYVKHNWLKIEEAAEVLDTSVRSIQRRLSEKNTTYSNIIEQLRSEIGAELLETTDARLIDVALRLGYASQGNFTRAFRRWAGVTPLEYRRQRKTARRSSLC